MKNLYVISLGGSLINPGNIDAVFLKKFIDLIRTQVKANKHFLIVTGGGRPAREYQEALKKLHKTNPDELDWMGIYTTRFHAHFLKLAFGKTAHHEIITDFEKALSINSNILLAGGWKPGRSSDGAMVKLARLYETKTVINLSNVDYVYTKDPRKFKDAKKIEQISWKNFLKITGTKWDPGANVPFDPTAAKFAMQHGLRVIIANGKNLGNLKNILEGKKFQGTIIE
jgi:uridylate kinase